MIARYSRPQMVELWSDRNRYRIWLEVELAATSALEDLGQVPAGTAAAVRFKARVDDGWAARIDEIEKTTRHDVIAFLTHVEALAGGPARYLHRGMTSSDVLDTAFAIQLRDAADAILAGAAELLAALRRRAEEHKKTPVVGRTHGMHAEPTTLGLVLLGHWAAIARARAGVVRARETIAVGKIAGAVGTYAHFSPEAEQKALGLLGLSPESVPTQVVARDRHAAYFSALAVLADAVERLALTIRHGQRTEVGELSEAFGKGQKGSSAMPHKRNPILSENLVGLARLVRAYASAAHENVALWHERDISHSSVERVIGPDATTAVDFLLARATSLVEGLVVDTARIGQNLDRYGDLLASEGVMLLLVDAGLGRQQAYEIVQRSALAALSEDGGASFRERIGRDPEVTGRVPATALASAFDRDRALSHVDTIFSRTLGSPGR